MTNIKDDITRYAENSKSKNIQNIKTILERFIVYYEYLNEQNNNEFKLSYTSGMVPIADRIL